MKILELHLRNIASIEKADIDFERQEGMIDPDSGTPARMFLIYGDTGTGKSVLLDSIAMALFGKTPRIEGVANKLRNTYVTTDGTEVNITSIEQYTRLGITDKDECYCEVLFEGNDGITYRARMELGLSRTKAGTYKNRKKWSLVVDGKEPIEGNQCGERIMQAIGMTFEQFNRMAMLAQGQFASFLCGGREERADILEKLTNTSIFTTYGQAIKSLHDKKKSAAEIARAVYEERERSIDSPEQVEAYTKQKADATAAAEAASTARKALVERVALVDTIITHSRHREEVMHRKPDLQQRFVEMYRRDEAAITAIRRQGTEAEQQVERLDKALRDAEAEQKSAADEVERVQKEIDGLTADRNRLDPAKVDADIDAASKLELAYNNLLRDHEALLAKQNECHEDEKSLDTLRKQYADETAATEKAKADYDRDHAAYEQAMNRFATISASLDEKLGELRRQLADGNSEICPLCGQQIGRQLLTREQFASIVSPFEQEKQRAKSVEDASHRIWTDAVGRGKRTAGAIDTLSKTITALKAAIDLSRQKLEQRMGKAGIAPDGNIADAIAAKLAELEKTKQTLREKKKQIADIQAAIDAKMQARQPYDKRKQEADTLCQSARAAVQDNGKRILDLREKADNALATIDTLRTQYAQWWGDIDALIREHPVSTQPAEGFTPRFDWDRLAATCAVDDKTCREAVDETRRARLALALSDDDPLPDVEALREDLKVQESAEREAHTVAATAAARLETHAANLKRLEEAKAEYEKQKKVYDHWAVLNRRFGGDRFRNLVQTYILRPLLSNANIYLRQITERYTLTCSEDNEQLSILVLDRYNRNEVRSAAVLSGGEKFMISLALSLALSSLNRPDMNVNILFIDEGFGTLDQECLDSVMKTLGRLSDMAGQGSRRVGIISHREELLGCIPNKVKLLRSGEGRSRVEVVYEP